MRFFRFSDKLYLGYKSRLRKQLCGIAVILWIGAFIPALEII